MSATHDADLSAAEIIVRRTYRDWKIAECKHELAKFHKNIFVFSLTEAQKSSWNHKFDRKIARLGIQRRDLQ